MTEEYSGTIRVGDKVYPTGGNWYLEKDVYLDHGEKPVLNPNEWTHTKVVKVFGLELTEYGRYWLDQAIWDYQRSLQSYRAHVNAKRLRKIRRKQKRATFRRRKRGLA